MKSLLAILAFAVSISANASEEKKSWTFTDENGDSNSILVFDDVKTLGEEMFIWNRGDLYTVTAKPEVTESSVEANVYLESTNGDTLVDANLGLAFGKSFDQMKLQLKDSNFRKAFKHLPEVCAEADTAFLTVVNNMTSEMLGYCLKSSNE